VPSYKPSTWPLLLFAIVLLSACQPANPPFECIDAIGCVDIAPGDPIKLGVLQALSGDMAYVGLAQARSMELAIARRDNQLLGHPIAIQLEDSRCLPEGGTTAALKTVADPQVVAILGTTCSGAAATAAEVMSKAGLVMISGAATAPSLTALDGERGADWQPGFFRTRPNGAEQGRAAATFAFQELGMTRAAAIHDGDPYTQGLAEIFEQAFAELGGEIVLDAIVNKGDRDMHPVLTAIASAGAELVFLPLLQPEGGRVVRQTKEVAGLESVLLMGSGALRGDPFIEFVGVDGRGMYLVGLIPPENSSNESFAFEYESIYGEPPLSRSYEYAHDAVVLLFSAVETTAVQDADGTLHIGRQALRDALHAVSDLEGLSGALACDEFGDCSVGTFNVVRLDDPSGGLEGLESNVVYTYTSGR
jgi:branched-chain amino acid transport system substrate-binding protein